MREKKKRKKKKVRKKTLSIGRRKNWIQYEGNLDPHNNMQGSICNICMHIWLRHTDADKLWRTNV